MTTPLTEAQLQAKVIDTARWYGWRVAHFRPAQVRPGQWATPMTGDVGFPDLVLARGGVVLLVELKTDNGKLGEGQPEWLAAAAAHGRLWRPSSWPEILEELK